MLTRFEFAKYHALGNDYIVMDPARCGFNPLPENVRLLCDRNRGVGSDGILFGPVTREGKLWLRVFNPDGGEAEKSGNGVRIFAKYLAERGHAPGGEVSFMTLGGAVTAHILPHDMIEADMGKPTFSSAEIPVNGPARDMVGEALVIDGVQYSVTCVSVGNPHCVVLCDEISRLLAVRAGPAIENFRLFPHKTNVQFMRVLDRSAIRIEIWERGAGYTLASGSSACAAASAARRLGLVDGKVLVKMPGGEVTVAAGADGRLSLTGEVLGICAGELASDLVCRLSPEYSGKN
jgi:diaminopimelate epimerase